MVIEYIQCLQTPRFVQMESKTKDMFVCFFYSDFKEEREASTRTLIAGTTECLEVLISAFLIFVFIK